MPSIKDVAEKSGVSIGAVSRALRGIGYLSEDIKQKVLTAADELGYIASYSAQQLKISTPEKVLGIIISESSNDYFYKVITQLNVKLAAYNMRLIVAYSSAEPMEEEKNIKYLISNRVSAIIFIPSSTKNQHKLFLLAKKNNIKIIQLFVKVYENLSTIVNDDEQGAALAAEYLLKSNCKKLLLLDAPYKNMDSRSVIPSRRKGFESAFTALSNAEHFVENYDPYADNASGKLVSILEKYNPDGVIAGIGKTGQQIVNLLHNQSYNFKFVTFDDNSWFNIYGISAINQDTPTLVDRICELILAENDETRLYRISESLSIRNT